MSNRPPSKTSPSTSPKHTPSQETSVGPELPHQQGSTSNDEDEHSEAPQHTAGQRSQHSSPFTSTGASNLPDSEAPQIIITGSPDSANVQDRTERAASLPRQGRSLVTRRRFGSSSQPPRRSSTPYSRQPRSQSHSQTSRTLTVSAMSSASSSPGNTSTSGGASGSGSNPSYHLPYAPFPYPMPGNGRGQGSNQGSGGGSGK
ncbi:hypothetical protein K491DRAFT_105817 [Lophiostoma macrostomum CBS 122681]|uniref:Uncharacterized protein n=1 Tax=Lophiostoma macrostomum CBS 122681 TaxID=1314788 RepID=A0A6A6TJS9_9PLEO|nr:hypothetical protein K491DRAFT_105817 [Lophiostoma macrostomum CBS 122681]